MNAKTITLATFHRNLALRVAAAGIVIALFFGGLVWHRQRQKVIDLVLERVVSGTRIFNQRIGYLTHLPNWPQPEQVQVELDRYLRTSPRSLSEREGRFIYVDILDREAGRIASQIDDTYPHIEALQARRDELKESLKSARSDLYRIYRLDGIPYVLTATPLLGADQKAIAYVQTIFAVSEAALQAAYGNVRRTVLNVIGIVLLTSFVIYPSILLLTRRLSKLTRHRLDANL